MVRSRVAILAGAALVALVTSVADAAVTKFKDWVPDGSGLSLNPDVDGMGIIKTHFDDVLQDVVTHVTISLHGLEANKQLAVQVVRDGIPILNNVQAFTTNSKGHGIFNWSWSAGGEVNPPVPYEYQLFVYEWDGGFEVPDPPFPGPSVPDEIITDCEARACSVAFTP